MNHNKKILITGGSGFLGSNLSKKLINNNTIYCIDNLSTGNKKNLSEIIDKENFMFINHDVINPYDIEIDEIYNLASPASPIQYQTNPINTTKTNIFGAINSLDLAKKYNAKILQASTSEIYGNPYIHPQTETYWGNVNPIGKRSCYDESKRCAESIFFDYHRQYKSNIKVVRIFNTYGPLMSINDGRVISNFIIQALKNKHISIFGNGSQTRSFCYVDDLINGIISIMNNENRFTGPMNLGSDQEISINELANLIINLTNSKSSILYKKIPEDDPLKRKPDLSLSKKLIDWQPKVSLEDGLNKTIQYFDEILKKI